MSIPAAGRESPTVHRLTGRLVWLVGGTLVLGLVGSGSGNQWFLLLAAAVLGVLVVGLAGRARLDGLVVDDAHRTRVSLGEQVPCRVTVMLPNPGVVT